MTGETGEEPAIHKEKITLNSPNTESKPSHSIKDRIFSAKTPKEVLFVYHKELINKPLSMASLQENVGLRLTQLGDIENGMHFTILAGNTRNVEAQNLIANKNLDAAEKMFGVSRRMQISGRK